jgi:hypothetical protein
MVTAHWLNDVLQRKKLFVPNLAIHYPSPFDPTQPDKLPLTKYFFTLTGFDGKSLKKKIFFYFFSNQVLNELVFDI